MKTVQDLKVGDTAWWSDVNRKDAVFSGAVSKIGTKLVTVDGLTFRKDTMRTNDNYGHQRLIPDLEWYQEQKECFRIMHLIRQHATARDVPLADVMQAAKLLQVSTE